LPSINPPSQSVVTLRSNVAMCASNRSAWRRTLPFGRPEGRHYVLQFADL